MQVETRVHSVWFQRKSSAINSNMISSVAFNINLRPCTMGCVARHGKESAGPLAKAGAMKVLLAEYANPVVTDALKERCKASLKLLIKNCGDLGRGFTDNKHSSDLGSPPSSARV